eukprot:gene7575-15529_t
METGVKVTSFKVGMTCEGCANAVKRILGKFPGVTDIVTDVESKIVQVFYVKLSRITVQTDVVHKLYQVTSSGSTNDQEMLDALLKWSKASGKTVELNSS